jgi:ATP-dependent Lon protease
VLASLVVLGQVTIQGHVLPVRSLSEALQAVMDNGAKRVLLPTENKRHFLDVSGDVVEKFDPIFYSDPLTAALRALGMN